MRLDFNVLWVDDQAEELDGTREALIRKFIPKGFQLNPTFCATVSEVESKLADDVFSDEIDLVLVDWELGGGDKGQYAIETIRETIPYKDIIFYSAKTNTEELRKLAYDLKLDGVYFTNRNDLVHEVDGVFESLVKKTLDLDHIRGIVMGATSDIEHMVRETLQMAHSKCSPAEQTAILEEMIELLDKKLPSLQKSIEKLKANPSVAAILAAHRTFTANDGARILKRVLGTPAFAQQTSYSDKVSIYIERVVPRRNDLGHKVLSPEGRPTGIAGGSLEELISFEEMIELRKQLLELRESFRGLRGSLG